MSKSPRAMSDAHKTALSEGRRQGIVVKDYLDALESTKPKRGRKRTEETVERQLAEAAAEQEEATSVRKLELIQRRRDLENELAQLRRATDMTSIEASFVEIAASYGSRRGIEYATWREAGVSAETLRLAGIKRST